GGRLVGDDPLDSRLEVPARDVDGAGEVPLVPLVLLAHVDPRGTHQVLRIGRVDLDDAILYFLEKFPVGRHSFKNYSSAPRIPRWLPFPRKASCSLAHPFTSPSPPPRSSRPGSSSGSRSTRGRPPTSRPRRPASHRCPTG